MVKAERNASAETCAKTPVDDPAADVNAVMTAAENGRGSRPTIAIRPAFGDAVEASKAEPSGNTRHLASMRDRRTTSAVAADIPGVLDEWVAQLRRSSGARDLCWRRGQRVPSSKSLSRRRMILPDAVMGTSFTNCTARGSLYAARCSRQCATSASPVTVAPGLRTT